MHVLVYDLEADPSEVNNQADAKPGLVEGLSGELVLWLDDQFGARGGAVTGQEISRETEEHLRALGYIE
jgi:hypothetical protein